MADTDHELQPSELKALKRKMIVFPGIVLLLLTVLIFLPAGTFCYWQAYVYIAVLLGPMVLVVGYFFKKDPRFLQRRLRIKEREAEQKKIVSVSFLFFFAGYLITGLDHRFGWSDIPAGIVLMADALVLAGYLFIFAVFKVNRYASRVILVDKDQTVITTGPYRFVRHPMYLGSIVLFMSSPIALGSYWGVLPFIAVPVSLVFRILNEEKVLSEQLSGYKEYCTNVRFRLLPFVW
ncbi:MAG: isoprenylcysteine carboxylmethyltransferase family protein [Deltaproteobacteria bacterium]|nr:isoprenylcysteine carboxylmethyltransferase family protein [Deltaproteobacteria bacterium]